ncbi:transcription factor/nuclear export subunit protein 2-domain-containing protein, partial [Powellomyces hirtus]
MEISQNINAQGSIPSQEQEFITKRIIAAWDTSGSSQILQTARTFLTNSADGSDTSMVAFRSLVLELFFAGLRGLMAITTIGTFFANLYKDTAKKTGSQEQENASGYVGPNGPGDALTIPSTLVDALWVLDQQTDPSLGEGVLPERAKLVALAKDLMSKHFIPEVMMRERLELEFQNAIGLINDTRGAAKKEVRMRTSMLYVQTKYNLLREEPEGFSKLITEVFRNLPPLFDCHEPSSGGPRLTKEEAAQRRAEAVEERAHIVMENIQSLIGYFDLDPNRVLDLILDSFTANIADHWDFFVRLLEMSPWRAKETTPNEPRSVCGQILGFKFDWYRGPTHTKSIPDALIFVAAVTIKHGLVALGDLYPHLSTPDEGVTTLYEELCKQYRKKERTAGRFKGLELTGSLADDGKESTAAAGGAATVIEVEPELQCDVNQKAEIAAALIAIGDFKHGFQILERLPNLVHLHPEIADNICRYLRLLIDEWDLKPLARATRLPKPSPEDYRPGANTINVKLAPVFERVNMGRKDNAPRYKFFYSDWKADKPTVRTVGELVQRIRMYLVHVGCHLHRDPLLVAQLIRIGALHVSENVKYESTVNGWLNVVVNYLLPAISCSDPNPANSQGLWTIIKQFPYEKRFALYGEWKNRLYGDNAEMQLARAGCERDCRYILSRLNKESAKQSGRQIGKVLHSNPVIAFSYIITRLEAYDNMIPYVVDATRYLTELEFDILPYCLIDALAVAKSKVQRNGLNISDWLKSLGSFTGQAFKKHPMDLEPLLRYLTNQLCSGNLHDLHILQEVIGTMSGVKIMDDVTEAQLEAIAGSETLKRESFFWEPMRTTRKSGNRLMKALIDTGFAKKLAILISQRKQEVPYIGMGSEDDNLDLKILSWLNDYCQRTLAQFLDFLAVTAPSESYSAAMPEVGELINLYGLDPEQAFSIARPKLATYVKVLSFARNGLLYVILNPINCNALKNNELQTDEMQVAPPKDTPNAATKSVSIDGKSGPSVMEFKSNPVWQTGLYSTIDSVIPILPPSAWRGISPMFYVTFWQLTLHDIFLPKERYSGEITHQKKIVRDLEREIAKLIQDFGVTEDVRKKRKDVDRANQVIKSLEGEWRAHEDHHAKVMERMTAESTHWFETSVGRNETIQMMIQYCLQPRCTQSPVDAVFCAKFIMMMHRLGTPFIPTVTLYD